jgi:hypothetical protein
MLTPFTWRIWSPNLAIFQDIHNRILSQYLGSMKHTICGISRQIIRYFVGCSLVSTEGTGTEGEDTCAKWYCLFFNAMHRNINASYEQLTLKYVLCIVLKVTMSRDLPPSFFRQSITLRPKIKIVSEFFFDSLRYTLWLLDLLPVPRYAAQRAIEIFHLPCVPTSLFLYYILFYSLSHMVPGTAWLQSLADWWSAIPLNPTLWCMAQDHSPTRLWSREMLYIAKSAWSEY